PLLTGLGCFACTTNPNFGKVEYFRREGLTNIRMSSHARCFARRHGSPVPWSETQSGNGPYQRSGVRPEADVLLRSRRASLSRFYPPIWYSAVWNRGHEGDRTDGHPAHRFARAGKRAPYGPASRELANVARP